MAGILYGIGVGPGDPKLLTLKAVETIKSCQVLAVPGKDYKNSVAYRIALDAVPEIKEKEVHSIEMPMVKDQEILKAHYQAGALQLEQWLDLGKDVGFLTLGDVTVYSTYLYLHHLVKADGYETEMINGIPSFCAAAARLDMGLAEGAQSLHIFPGTYEAEQSLGLEQCLTSPGTKVFMKAGKQMAAVKEAIGEAGLSAVMIERCTMEGERIFLSGEEIPEDAGYYSLVIVKEKEKEI